MSETNKLTAEERTVLREAARIMGRRGGLNRRGKPGAPSDVARAAALKRWAKWREDNNGRAPRRWGKANTACAEIKPNLT